MAAALDSLEHRFARSGDDCDRIVMLQDVAWEDYERLLELRGERPVPRIAYLDGVVELMSPSMPHESLKSRIGQLVEAWCLEKDIEFRAAGAWTLKNCPTRVPQVRSQTAFQLGNSEATLTIAQVAPRLRPVQSLA